MSSILNSKDAFKKGAVYDDEDGRRVMPRSAPKPEAPPIDNLALILGEIRSAMQLNAQLIGRLPAVEHTNFSEQIADNQKIMLQLLAEIKRTNTARENKKPSKWKSTIVRDRMGNMVDIIHTAIKEE